jgi:hypothetical protein
MSRNRTAAAAPELFSIAESSAMPDDLPAADLSDNARIILARR